MPRCTHPSASQYVGSPRAGERRREQERANSGSYRSPWLTEGPTIGPYGGKQGGMVREVPPRKIMWCKSIYSPVCSRVHVPRTCDSNTFPLGITVCLP